MKERKPSVECVEKLIADLQDIKIGEESIEPLLSTFLLLKYVNRFDSITLLKIVWEYISYFRQFIYSEINKITSQGKEITLDQNMPLLTFISSRRHMFKMNKEVLDCLNGESNIFLLSEFNTVPKAKGRTIKKQEIIFQLDFIKSNSNYRSVFMQTLQCFREFLKENKLSPWRSVAFKIHLQRQLAIFSFFDELFEQKKPKFILTEFDRYNEIAALVLAGKINKVPTFTQVHGLLNIKLAYSPILADSVFCWGNQQKKKLLKWGENENSVFISGATQLENKISNEIHNKELHSKKIILLATNPMNRPIKEKLVTEFEKCVSSLPMEWFGLIRLHPSEKLDGYQQLLRHHNRIMVSNNDSVPYNEAISCADLVLVYNSAFVIDAMIKGKTVLQLNVDDEYLGEVQNLIREKIIPSFQNGNDLSDFCTNFEFDENLIEKWQAIQSEYIGEYCSDFGRNAAQNIINKINLKILPGVEKILAN